MKNVKCSISVKKNKKNIYSELYRVPVDSQRKSQTARNDVKLKFPFVQFLLPNVLMYINNTAKIHVVTFILYLFLIY